MVCPGILQHDASSSAFGNRFKSPSHEKAWQFDMKGVHPQKYVTTTWTLHVVSNSIDLWIVIHFRCEHVAKGLISIIKEGKTGSVWLIANEKPPKEVPYSSVTMWIETMSVNQEKLPTLRQLIASTSHDHNFYLFTYSYRGIDNQLQIN